MVTQAALKECGYEDLDVGDTLAMSYGTHEGIFTGTFRICGIWDGYGPKKQFYVSKEFYDQSGWKLSQAASGRYFMDFKQKIMTKTEQNAFIASMNLGKQQNLFFMEDLGASVQILAGLIGLITVTCCLLYTSRKWFQEKMVNVCRAIRDQKEDQSNSAVKKAMLYIQENYSRDISLDDVSSQVNISPYYFSKIFKEETGENFIEYLTRVRIDKAKELLVDANVSVKEAGIQSGYSDPNYFSRIFKKQMDMTPSEYKARYGK